MMANEKRLIDANALLIPKHEKSTDEFIDGYRQGKIDALIEVTATAPTVDAVEVVRCKDCKHFCPYEGEEHKGDCAELVGFESCAYEDDFCSYGERRSAE